MRFIANVEVKSIIKIAQKIEIKAQYLIFLRYA